MSDVRVLGLIGGVVNLQDIGVTVPCGVTVTIPEMQAHLSKDLWRAISQQCIKQLPSVAAPARAMSFGREVPTYTAPVTPALEQLQTRVQAVEQENQRLQTALVTKEQESQVKLDAILALLRAGSRVTPPGATAAQPAEHHRQTSDVVSDVVSGDVPSFIPSTIKPEGVVVQITTASVESTGDGIGTAKSALRKFRKQ